MSETHDSSYYEVALTNKQVLSFFVVILVSLLVVFFAGVWIGRGASPEGASVEVVAQAGEAPAQDDENLKELNFFSDQSAGADEDTSDASPPASDSASKKQSRRAKSQPAKVEAKTEQPAAAAAQPAPAPPSRAAPTASAGELLVIQVFSSPDETRATALTEKLIGGGYSAYLSPVMVEGRTMHRVRIGPFRERAQAESVAREVEKTYQLSTWITR